MEQQNKGKNDLKQDSIEKNEQLDELRKLLKQLEEKEKIIQQQHEEKNIVKDQQSPEEGQKSNMEELMNRAKYSIARREVCQFNRKLMSFVERENRNIQLLQQKKQGLFDRRLRQASELQNFKKINPLDKALQGNNPLPAQYKFLWENNPQGSTPMNIGNKMTDMIDHSTQRRMNLVKSLRQSRGLYIWNSFKQGKMGVDAYFIIFALFGVAFVPYFLYQNLLPQKNFVKNHLGITKENLPDLWRQNKYDLDDISVQKTYYNLYAKEIEQDKQDQIKRAQLKQQIENQLRKY